MQQRAVSLIEVLISITLIGVISAIAIPVYLTYQVRSDLNVATENVAQGLGRARLLSQAVRGDSAWGFYVPGGVLYKGTDYDSRDPVYDEVYPMPFTITHSGLLYDVSFSKLEGKPSDTGEIILVAFNGEEREVAVRLLVSTDEVAVDTGGSSSAATTADICHKPGTYDQGELTIPTEALPAHLAHGDFEGSCPAPPPGTSCTRYDLEPDGTIKIKNGSVNVTVRVLGTDIKYGCETECVPIPVYLQYKKNNGAAWFGLFDDERIIPPDNDTASVLNNVPFALQIHGYLEQVGLLRFDETVTTNDSSDQTFLLRDGDSLPAFLPAAVRARLVEMLAGYLEADLETINVAGQCDLVLLTELSDLADPLPPTEDFTDAVLLLDFPDS